ncbi:MAG: hypothetical protein WCT99_01945 [Bacteroidota bacterium]|jgi:hypothetical protein
MKKIFSIAVFMIVIASAAPKPIEYHVQKKYHRMMLVLHGNIQWTVNRSGQKMEVLLHGNETDFVTKNMRYSFRDGVVKEFAIQPMGSGERKISIQLRSVVDDYKIYQDDGSKLFYVEFYPRNFSLAKAAAGNSPVPSPAPVQAQKTNAIVNIPRVALEQLETDGTIQNTQHAGNVSTELPERKIHSGNNASMWLVLVTVFISIVGFGAAGVAMVKRKKWNRKNDQKNIRPDFYHQLETTLSAEMGSDMKTVGSAPIPDDDREVDFSHSIEFAEQYLRSQGEFELQQRLELMSKRPSVQKRGVVRTPQRVKKNDVNTAAEKLGRSVGEVELMNRLLKYQKRQPKELV